MANKELTREEQIALLKKGVEEWNRWRSENAISKRLTAASSSSSPVSHRYPDREGS